MALSLVQHPVKNGQAMTVKEVMRKLWILHSVVTNNSPWHLEVLYNSIKIGIWCMPCKFLDFIECRHLECAGCYKTLAMTPVHSWPPATSKEDITIKEAPWHTNNCVSHLWKYMHQHGRAEDNKSPSYPPQLEGIYIGTSEALVDKTVNVWRCVQHKNWISLISYPDPGHK